MTDTTADLGLWKCPGSQLILPADAPRSQWLDARKAGLGGSDAASLMGDNPYDDGTPWFVWRDKTDPESDDSDANAAMERGRAMEPIVRELFEKRHPDVMTRRAGLHRSREYPTLLASVDALTSDGGGGEWKTATTMSIKKWPEGWDEGVCPPLYAWQAKHYMLVTGRSHWWVAALIIDRWELVVWRVERDPEELEYLATVETEFWRTYVEPRVEPDLDWDRYTSLEIQSRYPEAIPGAVLELSADSQMAHELRETIVLRRALAVEQKETEEAYRATTDRLRAIAEGYEEVQVAGKRAFTNKQSKGKGRVTNAGILAAYPDVDLDLCKTGGGGRSLYVDTKIWA